MLAGTQTQMNQPASESELDSEREESPEPSQMTAQAPNSPLRSFAARLARDNPNAGDDPIDFDLLDEIARELAAEESNEADAAFPPIHGDRNGNGNGENNNNRNSPETSSTWAINESTPVPSRPSSSRPLSHENQSTKVKGNERSPLNLFGKRLKKSGFEWNKRQEGAERIEWESQNQSQSQASTPRASRQAQEEIGKATQEQSEGTQKGIERTLYEAYDPSDLFPDARQFQPTNARPDEANEDKGYLEEDVLLDSRQLNRPQQPVGEEEEDYQEDIMLDARQLAAKQEMEDGEEGYEEDKDLMPDPRQFARATRSQSKGTEKADTHAGMKTDEAEKKIAEEEEENEEGEEGHDYNELLGSLEGSPTSTQPELPAQTPARDGDFVFHPIPDFPFDDLPPQAEMDDYDVEDVARAEREAELEAENAWKGSDDDGDDIDIGVERRGMPDRKSVV